MIVIIRIKNAVGTDTQITEQQQQQHQRAVLSEIIPSNGASLEAGSAALPFVVEVVVAAVVDCT